MFPFSQAVSLEVRGCSCSDDLNGSAFQQRGRGVVGGRGGGGQRRALRTRRRANSGPTPFRPRHSRPHVLRPLCIARPSPPCPACPPPPGLWSTLLVFVCPSLCHWPGVVPVASRLSTSLYVDHQLHCSRLSLTSVLILSPLASCEWWLCARLFVGALDHLRPLTPPTSPFSPSFPNGRLGG
jgi:hypothetical protein